MFGGLGAPLARVQLRTLVPFSDWVCRWKGFANEIIGVADGGHPKADRACGLPCHGRFVVSSMMRVEPRGQILRPSN